jgi:alcohol dehydrogenase class IV
MNFEFATAARIVFGRGQFDRLGELCRPWGSSVLVVRDGAPLDESGTMARLERALEGFRVTSFTVLGEPDLETVDLGLTAARAAQTEIVVGVGGGSVLDTAKAVAGLLTHPGTALDYLEVVGKGQPLERRARPLVAVPTTAGTGTEVTKNAVIAVRAENAKASMRSEFLLPRIALVDPSLTDQLPPPITASTGLDALTQLLESFVSVRAQPMTDALALHGLERVGRALRRAFTHGSDQTARDDMALAALIGGLCLANAGLGAVHGFAAPLGASFPVPHGVACAALLPHVTRSNIAALSARDPDSEALARYARAFAALLGKPGLAPLEDGEKWLDTLVADLGIPPLASYGVSLRSIPDLVSRARRASSMRGNPVVLTDQELAACLESAL